MSILLRFKSFSRPQKLLEQHHPDDRCQEPCGDLSGEEDQDQNYAIKVSCLYKIVGNYQKPAEIQEHAEVMRPSDPVPFAVIIEPPPDQPTVHDRRQKLVGAGRRNIRQLIKRRRELIQEEKYPEYPGRSRGF